MFKESPFVLTALSSGLLTACIAYDFERPPVRSATEREVFVSAPKPTPADILFVVDNSGSMADEQENLARNFEAFISQLPRSGSYQIGIVTTDVSDAHLPLCAPGQTTRCDRGELGGLAVSTYSPNGRLEGSPDVSQCEPLQLRHGCFRGREGSKIITSDMAPADQLRFFKGNVRVGSCGSGQEEGLSAMLLALSKDRLESCNAGFLREDANLIVVFVTDENDDDPQVTPVAVVVDELLNVKEASKVRVAVIGGIGNDGSASQCRIGIDGGPTSCGDTCNQTPSPGSHAAGCISNPGLCPAGEFCDRSLDRCENQNLMFWENCHWCSYYDTPSCCSALAGSRYVEFAVAMEQKIADAAPGLGRALCHAPQGQQAACLVDSICQTEFANTLERIANELIVPNRILLDPPAAFPKGVSVSLGDRQLSYGSDFTVSSDGQDLVLTPAPSEGQDVVVHYQVAECGNGECENPGGESSLTCPADCR
ncbi:MAG: VWA domain-containing protein [Deltaproteobacteria bacterium]|nr:VWA domain-containing protein [Deltaproteobacteria bacterium]